MYDVIVLDVLAWQAGQTSVVKVRQSTMLENLFCLHRYVDGFASLNP